jgi:hypothetical protein
VADFTKCHEAGKIKDKKSTQCKFTTKQTLERDYMNSIFICLEAYESYLAIMQIVYNYCEYPGHPTNISLLICPGSTHPRDKFPCPAVVGDWCWFSLEVDFG